MIPSCGYWAGHPEGWPGRSSSGRPLLTAVLLRVTCCDSALSVSGNRLAMSRLLTISRLRPLRPRRTFDWPDSHEHDVRPAEAVDQSAQIHRRNFAGTGLYGDMSGSGRYTPPASPHQSAQTGPFFASFAIRTASAEVRTAESHGTGGSRVSAVARHISRHTAPAPDRPPCGAGRR